MQSLPPCTKLFPKNLKHASLSVSPLPFRIEVAGVRSGERFPPIETLVPCDVNHMPLSRLVPLFPIAMLTRQVIPCFLEISKLPRFVTEKISNIGSSL